MHSFHSAKTERLQEGPPLTPRARRRNREAFARAWGLSTRSHFARKDRQALCRMLNRVEALHCGWVEALKRGGNDAQTVAALAALAAKEWDTLFKLIVEEFHEPLAVIWQYWLNEERRALIARAVRILKPTQDHWGQARGELALIARGPSFEACPSAAYLRAAQGVRDEDLIPVNQVVRGLVEALQTVFRP
jgi:hypothetical protein